MSLNSAAPGGIALLIGQLVERFPALRSIWLMHSPGASDWDLVAFADRPTLHRLREATDLHRADVLLRVVTDGDRFEVAWGTPHLCGSLFHWDWVQPTRDEAYYSEARWKEGMQTGNVERTRRRAACIWQLMPAQR